MICYMKPIVLLHPFFYFFVCSLCLCTCSIYLIQLNLYLNMIVRFCWGRRTTVSTCVEASELLSFYLVGLWKHVQRLIGLWELINSYRICSASTKQELSIHPKHPIVFSLCGFGEFAINITNGTMTNSFPLSFDSNFF